jgi:glycosyltransferase involved in cell wall biosynthesis
VRVFPRVAYLVTLFPKLSETFVLNEVVELQERGVPILPLCFDRSARLEAKQHGAVSRLTTRPVYLGDDLPLAHLRALGYWLFRKPRAVIRLLRANARHPAPRGESKLYRAGLALRAAREAESWRADHLHAHWSYPCDVALLLSEFLGLPMSFTAHAHDIFEDIELYAAAGYPWAERAGRAEFVVACTEHNAEHLRSLVPAGIAPRIHHAYHGLDVSWFKPGTTATDTKPTLLSIGRFVAYKGFDVIVRACAELRNEGRDFRCYLAGSEGSQTPVIEKLVTDLGLEDTVVLLGPQTQEEILELFRQTDVYVNASNPEGEYGVANVIVEALAMGIATIASDRVHVREYIKDGVNGVLVPYGDHERLAGAIGTLLDSPRERERLGGAGRRTVEARVDIAGTADALTALLAREPS